MTEAEKQALGIYEIICATSRDCPLSFNTVEPLKREMSDWKARRIRRLSLSVNPRLKYNLRS